MTTNKSDSDLPPEEVPEKICIDAEEDRFARFKLIAWWDQEKLRRSRVLVIGAGALGNELLKNLALLGVGQVFVADMDHIELTNLCRSVLFRPGDEGQPKAMTAINAAKKIYPDQNSESFMGNITTSLGLGVFRWADVVLGGLDNREARLFTNRACLKVGTPWVDGAIEALQGVVRAFAPGDDPCYECTLGENDWKILEARRACSLLTRDEMEAGRVPTTPTTSSVVAGLQCQEALKILHDLEGVLYSQAYVFDGLFHQSYTVNYSRNPECQSHEALDMIFETGLASSDTSLGELLELSKQAFEQLDVGIENNPENVYSLEFGRDIIESLHCANCEESQESFVVLGALTIETARCPKCDGERSPSLINHVTEDSPILEKSPAELGMPPWDILVARYGELSIGLELDGDKELVLGRIPANDDSEVL
ncbi:MAG: ThiF family adenylyltransferase [Planctomycetota bacterium]|nr:ThiF family adenylyltransferase [Planctomycetota bacterium]